MENVRLRRKIELVCNRKRCSKLINKTSFKSCTIFNENLAAIHMHNEAVLFNKPICVGFAVLEISKNLMYNFHYNHMRKMYNNKIELCYMDTGNEKKKFFFLYFTFFFQIR